MSELIENQRRVLAALKGVKDPELDRDLVDLDMIRDIKVCGPSVELTVVLTTPACPLRGQIEKSVRDAILARLPGIETVTVKLDSRVRAGTPVNVPRALHDVKNVVAIASGKGGVGKSTVSTNLAIALGRCGAAVGLLDADIHGPNIPMMMGRPASTVEQVGERIVPVEQHGIRFFSMGFLLQEGQAVIWRGPMLHGAVQQFLREIVWGPLDYLIVDLPPGTGDVQLSLCQTVELAGAVVVSTPQDVALADVRKGIAMFRQTGVPVLGIVENMSTFICPSCHCETDIFLKGGVDRLSKELDLPVLGSIPLDREVCRAGDEGNPVVVSAPDSELGRRFLSIAQALAARIAVRAHAVTH
ncbi:MAG: Mrp/NBP35 family ATP-binding protein [Candidatus Riflebacteria bacterium]|nr:Mrp/NBP35 family ATP-binding protein [Candidatus Riflebacteria bacterium]